MHSYSWVGGRISIGYCGVWWRISIDLVVLEGDFNCFVVVEKGIPLILWGWRGISIRIVGLVGCFQWFGGGLPLILWWWRGISSEIVVSAGDFH